MSQMIKKISTRDDTIGYQEGAVVSKTLIGKKGGTVTLFAFDEGQSLSEHTAPYDALVHLLEGEVDLMISGTNYLLEAGEIIIIPANAPHALVAKKSMKMMLVMIKSQD